MYKQAVGIITKDAAFFSILTVLIAIAIIFYQTPEVAMWFGFALAGYSAVANDSIQTLGTFLSSNKHRKWWVLWLFLGGIMAAVHIYGFIADSGDVAFGRLERIAQPDEFTLMQLLAPIVLIILTKLKMPVSTTFLLLSVFSSRGTIEAMLQKTASGYILAFVVAVIMWSVISSSAIRKRIFGEKYNKSLWSVLQWCSTGFLWASWLSQDTANVAVFLPRQLDVVQLSFFLMVLLAMLALILYHRGGKIQEIVNEKHDIVDIRSATLIDFTLALLLYFFKNLNNIPMSTTWVFLGVLAGREFALTRLNSNNLTFRRTFKLVAKDILLATIGLVISILVAGVGGVL